MGQGMGRGMGMGASYHAALPAEWFTIARPMHAAMNALAEEAGAGKRIEVALRHLADATAQCSTCHARFRIDSAPAPTPAIADRSTP
jgi:hypothetical protein